MGEANTAGVDVEQSIVVVEHFIAVSGDLVLLEVHHSNNNKEVVVEVVEQQQQQQ